MSPLLLLASCFGWTPKEAPQIPDPLPNAVEFANITADQAQPVMYDTYQVRGLLGSRNAIKNTQSYDGTQMYPNGRVPTPSLALVTNADGKRYPARVDITIKCPSGRPAYRLSNTDYNYPLSPDARINFQPEEIRETGWSNPAPLIGNPGAAFGSPQCYGDDAVIPITISYGSGGGGI